MAVAAQQHQHDGMVAIVLLYISYVGYYISKKNYGFWIPVLMQLTGLSKASVGILQSVFETSGAISKLCVGVFIDAGDAKKWLVYGLLLSGVCNLVLYWIFYNATVLSNTLSSSSSSGIIDLKVLTVIVGFNGIVQSIGWPALAKVFITLPIASEERRGFLYSVLSTSQNVGSALVSIVLTLAMTYWNDLAALWVPGVLAIGISVMLWIYLPETKKNSATTTSTNSSTTSSLPRVILGNSKLLYLGLTYCCISFVRSGVMDWCSVYLAETGSWSNTNDLKTVAGPCLILLEIGGCIGSIAAGYLSDSVFNGRRAPVMIIFTLFAAIATLGLLLKTTDVPTVALVYGAIGFFTFGPHVLVGLYARELVNISVASTAGGYVKFFGQIGSAIAGAPLGSYVDMYQWDSVPWLYTIACVTASLSLLPTLGRRKKGLAAPT